MASIAEYYNYVIYDLMDPRVKGWFLMDSPGPILLIITSYVLFIKRVGPWWMKGRPPYNVEKAMMLYNMVQMAINSYFVYVAMTKLWISGHYNWICQKPIYEPNPTEDIVVSNFYLFMCSRLLDLLDTRLKKFFDQNNPPLLREISSSRILWRNLTLYLVFMVLKKNKHQISFLHLYHHIFVGTACWICVKYMPGGHVALFGTINAFVHVVMYFYYLLTAVDASYKKSIWWKRHITELQLIQFVVLMFQQVYAMFLPTCEYPLWLLTFFLSQALLMIYLFSDFYYKAYIKKQETKKS